MLFSERQHCDYRTRHPGWLLMADEDIYGRITDGEAKTAQEQALRRMGPLGKTNEAAESTGDAVSDSRDLPKKAKP
jgi:hypothetical protein